MRLSTCHHSTLSLSVVFTAMRNLISINVAEGTTNERTNDVVKTDEFILVDFAFPYLMEIFY